jgi:uncharacterized protein
MPKPLFPGVYLQEASAAPPPIQGVSTSTAGLVGRAERGSLTPCRLTSWGEYQQAFGSPLSGSAGFLGHAVRGFFENGGQHLYVARIVSDGATVASRSLPTGSSQRLILDAAGPGAWGNRVFVRLRPEARGLFRLTVLNYRESPPLPLVDPLDPMRLGVANRREPDVIETFEGLALSPDSANSVISAVNSRSHLVRARWADAGAAPARPRGVTFQRGRLRGGSDGSPGLRAAQYTGNADAGTGLRGLAKIDEIAMLCVPDEAHPDLPIEEQAALRSVLVDQCVALGRFAVLNGPAGYDSTPLPPPDLLPDTGFAAMYLPWVRVPDAAEEGLLVPPSGHLCGVYARTDTQHGVHRAPANESMLGLIPHDLTDGRGPLEVRFTGPEQEALQARRLNVIRDFRASGRGIRVWGARTLSSDPVWKYVNLRRLLTYLERSIYRGLQWTVFEPNGEPLWAAVRSSIERFLADVWRSGALAGATAKEAFFIRCDRTTMTQDDLDIGRLIAEIGVAPVRPAEFVIVRIGWQTADDEP